MTSLILLVGAALGCVFGEAGLAYALTSESTNPKAVHVILGLLATGFAVFTLYLARAQAARANEAAEPSPVTAIALVGSVFAVTYGALQLLASFAG